MPLGGTGYQGGSTPSGGTPAGGAPSSSGGFAGNSMGSGGMFGSSGGYSGGGYSNTGSMGGSPAGSMGGVASGGVSGTSSGGFQGNAVGSGGMMGDSGGYGDTGSMGGYAGDARDFGMDPNDVGGLNESVGGIMDQGGWASGSVNAMGPGTYGAGWGENPGANPYGTPDFNPTEADTDLMARTMLAESGNIRNPDGTINTGALQGVGDVVRNRMMSDRFPGTVQGVISQPRQFEPYGSGAINNYGPNSPDYGVSHAIAESVLSGDLPSAVGTSLNFGNLNTINSRTGQKAASSATKAAFNNMSPDYSFSSATNPNIGHTFGTIGAPSDVAFNGSYQPTSAPEPVYARSVPVPQEKPALPDNMFAQPIPEPIGPTTVPKSSAPVTPSVPSVATPSYAGGALPAPNSMFSPMAPSPLMPGVPSLAPSAPPSLFAGNMFGAPGMFPGSSFMGAPPPSGTGQRSSPSKSRTKGSSFAGNGIGSGGMFGEPSAPTNVRSSLPTPGSSFVGAPPSSGFGGPGYEDLSITPQGNPEETEPTYIGPSTPELPAVAGPAPSFSPSSIPGWDTAKKLYDKAAPTAKKAWDDLNNPMLKFATLFDGGPGYKSKEPGSKEYGFFGRGERAERAARLAAALKGEGKPKKEDEWIIRLVRPHRPTIAV